MDRSFYCFVTIHACDRRTEGRTDGRTEFSSQYRVYITCSVVKIVHEVHTKGSKPDTNKKVMKYTETQCKKRQSNT